MFTAACLVGMLALVVSGRVAIDLVVLGAVLALVLAGVILPAEAVAGYSNTALITIAFLFVVTAGLRHTGALGAVSRRVMGRPRSVVQAQLRYVPLVSGISALTNNTTLVAAFMPILSAVARRANLPVGQLFMPLSFAAILGGVCTLIGTSTNLVVAGLLRDAARNHPEADVPAFSMVTLTPVGVPLAIAGIAYMLLAGRWLLPKHSVDPIDPDRARNYMAAMRVEPGSPVVGKTIEQADLRQLPGLFLSRIDRGDHPITAVAPETVILAGDVLVFVGLLDSLRDLREIRGLVPAADEGAPGATSPAYRPNLKLYEAVISRGSPLIGRTIRDAGLRTRYNAVVVAVQRLGHRLEGKLGDIRLRPGDTLLLESGSGFLARYRDSAEFDLVSEADDSAAPRHERASVSIAIFVGLVVVLLTGWIHEMAAAMLAAAMMILCRCCRATQARQAVDWQVLIVIGAAFALGEAMEKSGLAMILAEPLRSVSASMGGIGLLACTYAATLVITALISNTAAAVLVFPIVLQAALAGGYDPLPFAVCIALGASCEFITPIGYQTNLMVMGPGGYKFMDYVRFGGPLTVMCGVLGVVITAMVYPP
jgi:di/tricarboxylate transporter